MRKNIVFALALFLTAALGWTAEEKEAEAKPETYTIVKFSDHAKKISYKMMTQSEYKAMTDEIVMEAKMWDKAMAATEKAWKADPDTAKKSFSRTAVAQKKATVVEKYTDQDKASAKLTALEKSMAEDEEFAKQRAAELKNRKTQGNPNARKKETKGPSERDMLMESARSLFEGKMAEIIAAAAEKAAPQK